MDASPNAEQLFREAQGLAASGRWQEALRTYQRVLAEDNSHWKARFGCALARQRIGEHGAAIADLDAVIAIYPELPDAFYCRAVSHWGLQDFDSALADCDRSLRLRADSDDAQYLRCVCLKQLGRREEAIESLNVLLARNPRYALAHYCRATLVYMRGDFSAAIADLDVYLQAEPLNYGGLLLRGLAAHYENRQNEALEFLTRAIEVNPTSGSTYCRRALVFKSLGRTKEAADDLDKGRSLLGNQS